MSPFIIEGRVGVVHATGHAGVTCRTAKGVNRTRPVSSNQAMVYKLPRCSGCWSADQWNEFIRGGNP